MRETDSQGRTKRRGRGMGVSHYPLPPPPHPLFKKAVDILTQFPDPMLSVNLEYFIIKTKCRILSISSPAEIKLLPAMAGFKEVI